MCYHFMQRRSRMMASRSMVDTLIVYTINSSALTTVCAILFLVTYAVMPQNLYFLTFQLVLPELYINALLALLNSRNKIREAANNINEIALPLSNVSDATDNTVGTDSTLHSPPESTNKESRYEDIARLVDLPQLLTTGTFNINSVLDISAAKSDVQHQV